MPKNLRLRILAWVLSRRPTACDECGKPLGPGNTVERRWCSEECADTGWERQQT